MPCPSLHCTCASMQVVSPWWLPGGISRFSAHFPPPPYICDLVLQQDFRPSTSKKSQVSTLCTPRARIWSSIHHISPGNIPRCGNPLGTCQWLLRQPKGSSSFLHQLLERSDRNLRNARLPESNIERGGMGGCIVSLLQLSAGSGAGFPPSTFSQTFVGLHICLGESPL